MGKIVRIARIARKLIPPTSRGGNVVIGKSGALARRARDGAVWVSKAATTATGAKLGSRLSRAVPWLIGGSVAWELGSQLFDLESGGRMIDEEGSPIASLGDSCYNIHDHMRDKTRLKALCKDLMKIKTGISEGSDQQFITTMSSGDHYTLDDEASALVLAYQARREMVSRDFLFTDEALASTYFNDMYVGCYNPETGFIDEPTRLSWGDLYDTIFQTCSELCREENISDLFHQFADLDGFIKLSEFRMRVLNNGLSTRTVSAPDFRDVPTAEDPLRNPTASGPDQSDVDQVEDMIPDLYQENGGSSVDPWSNIDEF